MYATFCYNGSQRTSLWVHVHPLLWGGIPSLLATKSLSCTCADRGVFPWSQEWSPISVLTELSFCHKLCLWSVWARTKLEFYSTWQTPAVQPRDPSISYFTITTFLEMKFAACIFDISHPSSTPCLYGAFYMCNNSWIGLKLVQLIPLCPRALNPQ